MEAPSTAQQPADGSEVEAVVHVCDNWCKSGKCSICNAACYHDCGDDCDNKLIWCLGICKGRRCEDCGKKCCHDCKLSCNSRIIKKGQGWRKDAKGQHPSLSSRPTGGDLSGSSATAGRHTRQSSQLSASGSRRISLSPQSVSAAAAAPAAASTATKCMRCLERDHPDEYAALYDDTVGPKVYDDNEITNSNEIITFADAVAALGTDVPGHARCSHSERKKKIPKAKAKPFAKHVVAPMCRDLIGRLVPGNSKTAVTIAVGQSLVASLRTDGDDDDDSASADTVNMQKPFDRLMANALVPAYNQSRRGSTERRVASAILYKGQTESKRNSNKKKFDYTMGGETEKKAAKDFDALTNDGTLEITIHSRKKMPDEVVAKAVQFIFDKKNVEPLSWGTKEVKLSKDEVTALPKLTRRRDRKEIYMSYVKHTQNDRKRLGRTTFYNILNVITSREETMKTSVDYVTGILVNEPVEISQSIIDKFTSGELHERLTEDLTVAKNFLKYQYDEHAIDGDGDNDDDAYHSVTFSLQKPNSETEAADPRDCKCTGCKFPFYVCNQIMEAVENSDVQVSDDLKQSAKRRISDTRAKFLLFMEHRCRVVNQRRENKATVTSMKSRCRSSGAFCIKITIDWKMRFEGKNTRETSQEFYGKRHMGWHGGHCEFFTMGDVEFTTDDGDVM